MIITGPTSMDKNYLLLVTILIYINDNLQKLKNLTQITSSR